MNKQQFNEALCFIDADLVESYIQQDDALKKSAVKRNMWLRVGAAAACFCVMVAAVFALPMMLRDDPPPIVVEDTTPTDTTTDAEPPVDTTAPIVITNPNAPPKAPLVEKNSIVSGARSVLLGTTNISSNTDYMIAIREFKPNASVLEVKVMEILPDVYYFPSSNTAFYVAKLKVLDEIHGAGFPEEIYYMYSKQDRHIFDGYSSLIISVRQYGVENFVLINDTSKCIEYFPNMFINSVTHDPGYGSVIAFTDGIADNSFWVRAKQYSYVSERETIYWDPFKYNSNFIPASYGDTVEDVKQKILQEIDDDTLLVYDYVTADDIFITEEQKEILNYIAPDDINVFCHQIGFNFNKAIYISCSRIINGVETRETISVSNKRGYISRSEEIFTEQQLKNIPNVGMVLAQLDLAALVPPNITLDERTTLRGCEAIGWYRNIDGNIYGIVRIYWVYNYDGDAERMNIKDDMYYLYDSGGNARIVDREELKAVIGEDGNIMSFKYEPQYEMWIDY